MLKFKDRKIQRKEVCQEMEAILELFYKTKRING